MIVIIMTQSHFRIPVHPIDWNTTPRVRNGLNQWFTTFQKDIQ